MVVTRRAGWSKQGRQTILGKALGISSGKPGLRFVYNQQVESTVPCSYRYRPYNTDRRLLAYSVGYSVLYDIHNN
jgi:hypothetical protein